MRAHLIFLAALLLPTALYAQRVELNLGGVDAAENAINFEGAYTHTFFVLPGNKGLAGSLFMGYWDQIPGLFRKFCYFSLHDYPCEAFYGSYLGSRLHLELLRRPLQLALTGGAHVSRIRSRYLNRPGGRTVAGIRWSGEVGLEVSLPLSRRLWLAGSYRAQLAIDDTADFPFGGSRVWSLGLAYAWR